MCQYSDSCQPQVVSHIIHTSLQVTWHFKEESPNQDFNKITSTRTINTRPNLILPVLWVVDLCTYCIFQNESHTTVNQINGEMWDSDTVNHMVQAIMYDGGLCVWTINTNKAISLAFELNESMYM